MLTGKHFRDLSLRNSLIYKTEELCPLNKAAVTEILLQLLKNEIYVWESDSLYIKKH